MKLKLVIPVLGALALVAAVPDKAEAKSRSSFDISIGLGYSSGGYRGGYYGSGASYRYSRGHYGGYHRPYYSSSRYCAPRVYYPRPVYRDYSYYRPAPRVYYRDYTYYRPVYSSYYYRGGYCD